MVRYLVFILTMHYMPPRRRTLGFFEGRCVQATAQQLAVQRAEAETRTLSTLGRALSSPKPTADGVQECSSNLLDNSASKRSKLHKKRSI